MWLWGFVPLKKNKFKKHLISVKKVEKIADNKAQLELKSHNSIFYKEKNKNHTYCRSKNRKNS